MTSEHPTSRTCACGRARPRRQAGIRPSASARGGACARYAPAITPPNTSPKGEGGVGAYVWACVGAYTRGEGSAALSRRSMHYALRP